MARQLVDSDSADDSGAERKSATVCFLCRQRKTKCNRRLPSCSFCIKAKVDCQYVPKPRKRGLRAGYVSQLEHRLEYLEAEVDTLKRTSTSQTAAVHSPPTVQPSASLGNTPSTAQPRTPSVWNDFSHSRQRRQTESDAALKDLMTLPTSYLSALAEVWFKENQPWCPILSHEHILSAVSALPTPVDYVEDIELRAVLALEISYSTQAICLGYHGRHRLSQYLRSEVLSEAMSSPSLSSLRALIIMALMDYGSDNLPSTFSLMSIARRTCENLGIFRKLLNQIEGESPAQVGPPPVDTSGGDAHTISVAWGTLALDAVSTLGVSWRDVSAALVDHLSSIAYVSTPRLRDSYRAHMHLAAIGLQPVHQFLHDRAQVLHPKADDETLVKCDEMYQNLLSYVRVQPTNSYTILENGLVDFDPNLVHQQVLVYATIIMIYQGLVRFDSPSQDTPLERCLEACNEGMVTVIRSISDADAELNTPLLAHFFFVAARFKLVWCRAMGAPLDIAFDTLMHAVNMCSRRWAVARRLDLVLRTAALELVHGKRSTSFPTWFWDMNKSHIDISEELKAWATSSRTTAQDSSLSGPYTWMINK